MDKMAMNRQIKYALSVHYTNDGRRFSKSDRKHLLLKARKRGIRNFIKRDTKQEIKDALESGDE